MPDLPEARWPGHVAVAVVDGTQVLVAASEEVLNRLIAVRVVAQTPPGELATDALERIRAHLGAEEWADAAVEWMAATGSTIDAYPDESVITATQLGEDRATLEIGLTPIFDPPT
ncbi:MAG: hypothetical protein S0880_00915 [Actinomycetota bacterium]|nr:hypothetical protein [Actinomycetota bacterium]